MNIVYTFDDGYSEITAVSMVSLLENHKKTDEMKLFIVDCGIKDENKKILSAIAERYGRTLRYVPSISVQDKIKVQLDTLSWSEVCYVRLFFAEMFPELDRVLHIDCDTLVCGDLSDVYQTDLKGAVCGACYDCIPSPKQSAGFSKNTEYFSNGFLLFDLEQIRKKGILNEFISYIEDRSGKLPHLDQDVINGVLNTRLACLPPEYNLMTFTIFFGSRCVDMFEGEPYYTKQEVLNAVTNARVVHFTGYRFASRPWAPPCYHPYNEPWIRYYSMTPYWKEKKMLVPRKKKYGMIREWICWIWNKAYAVEPLRNMLFAIEKQSMMK